jgi:hypothetical protein
MGCVFGKEASKDPQNANFIKQRTLQMSEGGWL